MRDPGFLVVAFIGSSCVEGGVARWKSGPIWRHVTRPGHSLELENQSILSFHCGADTDQRARHFLIGWKEKGPCQLTCEAPKAALTATGAWCDCCRRRRRYPVQNDLLFKWRVLVSVLLPFFYSQVIYLSPTPNLQPRAQIARKWPSSPRRHVVKSVPRSDGFSVSRKPSEHLGFQPGPPTDLSDSRSQISHHISEFMNTLLD